MAKGSATGLIIFCTKDIINNLDEDRLSAYLHGMPVKLVPAINFKSLQACLHDKIHTTGMDWLVLIHTLSFDARNIALEPLPELEKKRVVGLLALNFCDLIDRQILQFSPHFKVLISLLLPRYDFQVSFD